MSDHTHVIFPKDTSARSKEAYRVTAIGAVLNAFLAIGKMAAGIYGSSTAMIADAVHSFSDLVTDAIVYISTHIASKEADQDHPYGHGRAETIGTAVLGFTLIIVGIFIVFEVIERLIGGELLTPTWPAITGAIVSIVVKEALYQYTAKVGAKINNEIIIANAWHHRSDAISSIAALVGIAGAMMGYPLLDPLAAIVVVFMIVKIGWEIAWKAMSELMDTSLPADKVKEIRDIIMSTEGVLRYHELRARKLGADIFVDAHILVQPNISVSEAHNIAETARFRLKENVGVADALIHIDAEEDIDYELMLVNRREVEKRIVLETKKIEGLKNVSDIIIHYLKKKVCVEFNVDMDDSVSIGEAKSKMVALRDELVRGDMIDMAVISGRLTDGLLESDFVEGRNENP